MDGTEPALKDNTDMCLRGIYQSMVTALLRISYCVQSQSFILQWCRTFPEKNTHKKQWFRQQAKTESQLWYCWWSRWVEPRDLWAWENLIIVISLLIMWVVKSVLRFFFPEFFHRCSLLWFPHCPPDIGQPGIFIDVEWRNWRLSKVLLAMLLSM